MCVILIGIKFICYYKQVVLNRGLPFNAKLKSYPKPVDISKLSADEFNAELMKGYKSIKNGKKYTLDEVDEIFAKEFGI